MEGTTSEVMLQGFHWYSWQTSPWWSIVRNHAAQIKEAGFSMVWLPPPSDAASNEGYLPRELYKLDTLYGRQSELVAAIRALRSNGIKIIADIVINHRVGTTGWEDFTNPAWDATAVCRSDEWKGANGNDDSGEGYHAARDIDHSQAQVQRDIKQWMGWLRSNIGCDGWRYDYVKGYAGQFVGIYNQATAPYFSVGELWTDLDINHPESHRQQLMRWIDSTDRDGNSSTWADRSAAFDFTTKGLLQYAVQYGQYWRLRDQQGRPAGALGLWGAKVVTFIDNHDTGPSYPSGGQNHWPFPESEIMQGYAYILTHPGLPCVYWVHYFGWGYAGEIKQLMDIRRRMGITASSSVSIEAADSSKYAAIINGRAGKVAVKIGPGAWSPVGSWTLAASGKNYAVWSQAAK